MNLIGSKNSDKHFPSLINGFINSFNEKPEEIIQSLEEMNYLRGEMHIIRDNYYSHVLNRCYQTKNKKPETFKYLLEIMLDRTKNKIENQILQGA